MSYFEIITCFILIILIEVLTVFIFVYFLDRKSANYQKGYDAGFADGLRWDETEH